MFYTNDAVKLKCSQIKHIHTRTHTYTHYLADLAAFRPPISGETHAEGQVVNKNLISAATIWARKDMLTNWGSSCVGPIGDVQRCVGPI